MPKALALLEFDSVATGMLAVDRMLKKSPVALLRCGTVHPGRYLALVGGTVAATEEAHAEGTALGRETATLVDEVLLPDPHPALNLGLVGDRREPAGDSLAVLEVSSSPAILRVVEAILKRVPVQLSKLRLADDLGGRALAVLDGELTDIQEAVEIANANIGSGGKVLGASIMARMDETLRKVIGESTEFRKCRNWTPEGAEKLEE
jgi:microcompartment protein CcmL/EutN